VFDFPLTRDREELRRVWNHVAGEVAAVLNTGSDVCYLTLGDTLLYSTYIYMVHALRQLLPDAQVVTIPGITAFSAAAAISAFAVGAGEETVTIVPATDDLASVKRALAFGGTVVIMKVGNRLRGVVELLERKGFLDRAVFVARAGLAGERMETDLRRLQSGTPDEGNLSVILVNAAMENDG
jgi:precorrin-2/cobalt-factor-2 C20-methyltransferase